MTTTLFSPWSIVLLAAVVLAAPLPARAIQYMTTGGSGGGVASHQRDSAIESLKKTWDGLDERVKDHVKDQVNEKIVDPVKDAAKERAKQEAKNAWKKIENSKKFGPAAKKLAKRLTPAAKKLAHYAGPAGQVYNAWNTGTGVGDKIYTYAVDPLLSAHFDKKQQKRLQQMEQELKEYAANARREWEERQRVREWAAREEQRRQELARQLAEVEQRQASQTQQRQTKTRSAKSKSVVGAAGGAFSAIVDTLNTVLEVAVPVTAGMAAGLNPTYGTPSYSTNSAFNRTMNNEYNQLQQRIAERDRQQRMAEPPGVTSSSPAHTGRVAPRHDIGPCFAGYCELNR